MTLPASFGGNNASVAHSSLTTFVPLGMGANRSGSGVTTEAQVQLRNEIGSNYNNLGVCIITIAGTPATATFTVRRATSNTNVAVSITGTGQFQDLTHTAAFSAASLVDGSLVMTGGSFPAITIGTYIGCQTGTTVFNTLMSAAPGGANSVAASLTRFFPLNGMDSNTNGSFSATEAVYNVLTAMRSAGTASNYQVVVGSNTSTNAVTTTFRVSGVSGNQTLSLTAATTGLFEDATHTDTYAATDTINGQWVTGAGTSNTAPTVLGVCLSPSASAYDLAGGNGYTTSSSTLSTSAPSYFPILGSDKASYEATEANAQVNFPHNGSFSHLRYGVTGSAGTSGTMTGTFRKNGASGNQSVSIANNTTGLFEDTTHTDSVATNDLVNSEISGLTGGTVVVARWMSTVTSAATETGVGGMTFSGVSFAGQSYDYTTKTLFITSGTTFTVPSDFNTALNTAEAYGSGGNGAAGTVNGAPGGGGGSGGYSIALNVPLIPGSTATVQIGVAGVGPAAGNDTFLKDSNGTTQLLAQSAANGTASTGGAAAPVGRAVGSTTRGGRAGGAASVTTAAAGGGGAGGSGPAGLGGGAPATASGHMGGTGGSGANAGSATAGVAGGTTNGGAGGTGPLGDAGGSGGTAAASAGNGTNGSGGGGGSIAFPNGGNGSQENLYTATTGGALAGPGSGGGGGGNGATAGNGGNAGGYGAGGGGGAANATTAGTGGTGAPGIIVIRYVPAEDAVGGMAFGGISFNAAGTDTRTAHAALTFGGIAFSAAGSAQNKTVGGMAFNGLSFNGLAADRHTGTVLMTFGGIGFAAHAADARPSSGLMTFGGVAFNAVGAVEHGAAGGMNFGSMGIQANGAVRKVGAALLSFGGIAFDAAAASAIGAQGGMHFGGVAFGATGAVTQVAGQGLMSFPGISIQATGFNVVKNGLRQFWTR